MCTGEAEKWYDEETNQDFLMHVHQVRLIKDGGDNLDNLLTSSTSAMERWNDG